MSPKFFRSWWQKYKFKKFSNNVFSPVFCVVDGDEVLNELVVRLADVTALPLVRPEDLVVVQRIVDHRETCRRG